MEILKIMFRIMQNYQMSVDIQKHLDARFWAVKVI